MLRSRYMLFFQIPRLPETLPSAGNFAALGCALKNGTVHEGAITDDDLRYFRAAFRNPYSITAALNYYRANFRPGVLLRTRKNEWIDRKIEAPTLMIWVNRILRWARTHLGHAAAVRRILLAAITP